MSRQALKQFEQRDGVIILHFLNQLGITFHHDQVQGGITEYREPEEGKNGRHQHYTHHKLADGTATADLGDEQADKKAPRRWSSQR